MFNQQAMERDFPSGQIRSGKDHLMIDYSACTDSELALCLGEMITAAALDVLIDRYRPPASSGWHCGCAATTTWRRMLAHEAFVRIGGAPA